VQKSKGGILRCYTTGCRTIWSLVAGFALMFCRYRIIVLRCHWLITPVIHGKISSLISRLCACATGVAEILFEQPVRLLRDYRGFPHRGSHNYFLRITWQRPSTGHYQRRADCGHNQQNHGTNNRRLQRLSRPTWRLTRRSKSVSTCILVGFNLLWGCSNIFRSQRKMRATPRKRHSARPVRGELFSIRLQVTTWAI